MFRTSGKPNKADRFWPRLLNAVLNKIGLGHRNEQYPYAMSVPLMPKEDAKDDSQHVLADTVSRELKDIMFSAMRRLKPKHRAVLILRCFREMEYEQIAESLECSEFAAKVHFCRAKRAFSRQLSRNGFGRGTFLAALVLFGKITAPTEAAANSITVSAAAAKVGAAAGIAALASSKAAILSIAAAGVITVGAIVANPGSNLPAELQNQGPTEASQITHPLAPAAKGSQQYWHYYPRGTNGPVMMRLVKSDAKTNGSYCQWLQNERANYYFDRKRNAIFIRNHRIWHDDLAVWRLPTDTSNMRRFLAAAQPQADNMQYVRGDGAGLLVILQHDENSHSSRITRHINVLDEKYFLYDWPSKAQIKDTRDAMHKRGWTYFTISGQIDGREVSGTGRLPFVYATSQWNYPWLKMTVAGKLDIIDTGAEARLYDASGKLTKTYNGGAFFEGLARPWLGLHAVDTVRRDAANERMWFETQYEDNRKTAKVTVNCPQTKLTYDIDLKRDLIKTITLTTSDAREGILQFSYVQDVDETTKNFVSPRQESPPKWRRDRLGISWIAELMNAH